jgi:hypothetical protein
MSLDKTGVCRAEISPPLLSNLRQSIMLLCISAVGACGAPVGCGRAGDPRLYGSGPRERLGGFERSRLSQGQLANFSTSLPGSQHLRLRTTRLLATKPEA